MKINRIIESSLIFIIFNLHNVSAIIFGLSLVLVALFNFLIGSIPVIISYAFWFSLGFFSFSLVIRKAIVFLEKKYKEENKYYIKLLEKKDSRNQLRVVFKRDDN